MHRRRPTVEPVLGGQGWGQLAEVPLWEVDDSVELLAAGFGVLLRVCPIEPRAETLCHSGDDVRSRVGPPRASRSS